MGPNGAHTSARTCGKITFLRQQLAGCYYHVNSVFVRMNAHFVTEVQSNLTLQQQAALKHSITPKAKHLRLNS